MYYCIKIHYNYYPIIGADVMGYQRSHHNILMEKKRNTQNSSKNKAALVTMTLYNILYCILGKLYIAMWHYPFGDIYDILNEARTTNKAHREEF